MEAVQRLHTICLGACDGIQDLADDVRYKALRKALLASADLRALAPAFIAAQPNLPAFVRYVRETKDRDARRQMVRANFAPLLDAVRGGSSSISASHWTGRPSMRERAVFVLALSQPALSAIERLIDEEERSRDNGGPIEPDRDAALHSLKVFHQALGDLIEAARAGHPLQDGLDRLKAVRRDVAVALGKAAGALPVTTSALLAFGTVVGITDLLVGNLVVSLAAGGIAGNTLKDVMLKKEAAEAKA